MDRRRRAVSAFEVVVVLMLLALCVWAVAISHKMMEHHESLLAQKLRSEDDAAQLRHRVVQLEGLAAARAIEAAAVSPWDGLRREMKDEDVRALLGEPTEVRRLATAELVEALEADAAIALRALADGFDPILSGIPGGRRVEMWIYEQRDGRVGWCVLEKWTSWPRTEVRTPAMAKHESRLVYWNRP
jgi:hypothetical protein